MNLAKMIEANKALKAQFDNVVYLEGLVDSIDYMKNETSTQKEIDDFDTVNDSFVRALEIMGLTPAQYYEVKEILTADKKDKSRLCLKENSTTDNWQPLFSEGFM